MAHHLYYHRPSLVKEIGWLVAFNVIALICFSQFDMLEWIYQFSRQHESWELDELIPLGATLTTSLLIFSYRRIVELGQVTAAFEKLSLRDPLTQLLNRRAAQIALSNWEKSNTPFSLIQIDLDAFKQINNLYGASVGDEILIKVADFLTGVTPSNGDVYRWLDDNFLIIAPLSEQSPFDLAHTISNHFETQFSSEVKPITCGIGISISKPDESVHHLLERVEDALMQAKHLGKNKVKVA